MDCRIGMGTMVFSIAYCSDEIRVFPYAQFMALDPWYGYRSDLCTFWNDEIIKCRDEIA